MDVLQSTCKVTIEEELKRNPKLDRQMIQSLQDWVKKQPHLPSLLDNQLVIFLVVCQNSVEQAKKLIDIHYTMKTHYDLFRGRDILSPPLQDAMDVVNITGFKGLDFDGRRVNFSSLRTFETAKYHGPTTVKLIYMYEDLMNYYYGSHAAGTTVVMDATGFSVAHLSTLTLSFLKQTSQYFTQGANVLVNSIIVINANPVAEKLVMLVRPFLPPDIYRRIHILPRDKPEKLFEYMPRSVVPSDFGGEGQSVAELVKETYQILLDNRDFYLVEEKLQRVNEAVRPANSGNGKIGKDLAGSFKKLDLD